MLKTGINDDFSRIRVYRTIKSLASLRKMSWASFCIRPFSPLVYLLHFLPYPTRPPQAFLFHIPFISDRIDYKIRKIFRDHGMPVRSAHRSHTLRQALQKKTEEEKCDLKNSSLNNHLSTKKNCVLCVQNDMYEVWSMITDQFYIGSNKRKLQTRIRENLSTDKSSVFTMSVLDSDTSAQGLWIPKATSFRKYNH